MNITTAIALLAVALGIAGNVATVIAHLAY
jgi:hypothetical protein